MTAHDTMLTDDSTEKDETASSMIHYHNDETEEKSQTFRKRRLTYTKHHLAADAAAAVDDDDEKEESSSSSPRLEPVHKTPRLEIAVPPEKSKTTASFTSRVVHAGEMVRELPLSPTASTLVQRLYQPPFSFSLDAQPPQEEELSWKKRHTHHDDDDETCLPFPRHVVGIYSCHGVEPVYDSDYAPEEEDDENDQDDDNDDDDDWLLPEDSPPSSSADDDDDDDKPQEENEETKDDTETKKQASEPEKTKQQAKVAAAAAPETTAKDTTEEEPQQQQEEATTIPTRQDKLSAKINQDRAGVTCPYGNCPRTAFFAVYDGHGQGGEAVSQFALNEIPRRLQQHPDFLSGKNVNKAFLDTFRAVDFALTRESQIEPLYAGTTACVALLRNDNTLCVANAGDSRAVLATRKKRKIQPPKEHEKDDLVVSSSSSSSSWEVRDLTVDQNPDLPQEQARIEQAGGFVSPPPEKGLSARVWLDCDYSMIGLAMSRSIGDHAVKTVGVIADPVVTTHPVTEEDDFLILATDGVWEFMESKEAVDIVVKHLENGEGAARACQKLIEAAASKWHQEEGDYRDDISAVVVRLQELWKSVS